MSYQKYLVAVFALFPLTDAVKVNMQGSLSFGKEVMDTLTRYIGTNYALPVSGRRSMSYSKETDVLYIIIKSTYLCRDLQFCDGILEKFLNDYVMYLTKSIESIFEEILSQREVNDEESQVVKQLIFEEELKKCLREIRKLLRTINLKSTQESGPYLWIEVIKKISLMFQTAAIMFAVDRLEGTETDIDVVTKKLTQKFVIATVTVESKYEVKLCSEYEICSKSYECTKSLNILLSSFKDMEDEKVKNFIRYVSEAFLDTKFYNQLSEVTANEMQIILNDMAYSDNVPAKEVLLTIQKTIEERLNSITTKTYTANGRDVELVHVILSDMDHLYSKRKVDPFHSFLSNFFEWSRSGAKLGTHVRTLLTDIEDQLNELSDDLFLKLVNEVKTFLEITVDPEK
ncbi:uncharacterized protein LOC113494563 [Trichoplusia ni]|uniref:Uncharacterized protein LOC113494563 n=1 Tax=Trichoplusia ni TaxID=7111 RepID=A0A7E5VKD1_TRINI|nr:uncharacterized protein LOC113494563 [Trichoplusia ni]